MGSLWNTRWLTAVSQFVKGAIQRSGKAEWLVYIQGGQVSLYVLFSHFSTLNIWIKVFVLASQFLIDDVFAKFPPWAVYGIGWVLDRKVVSYVGDCEYSFTGGSTNPVEPHWHSNLVYVLNWLIHTRMLLQVIPLVIHTTPATVVQNTS